MSRYWKTDHVRLNWKALRYIQAIIAALSLNACGMDVVNTQQAPSAPIAPVVSTPVQTTPTAPPPVTSITDDTDSLQALMDAGGLIQLQGRTYHTTRALIARTSDTTLRGVSGTVIEFQSPPVGTLRKPGTNDRVIGTNSLAETTQLPIAHGIAVGDTSFTALYQSDVANLNPNDWVVITVNDPGIADENTHLGYPTYVDWMQVAYVDGATVHVLTPFRMAFTNSLAFQTNSSGLGFVRVNLLENLTIQDLTITVDPGAPVVGVYVLGSLNTLLSHVTINDAGSDQVYTEESKGLTLNGCSLNGGTVLNEISESVDFTITNSTFTASHSVPIALDLGTGFFHITDNQIQSSYHIGIYAFYNVHDGSISGNTIAAPTGGSDTYGMMLLGSPNVAMDNNVINGDSGASGILAEGFAGAALTETSQGDTVSGNTITGYQTQTSIH